MRALILRKSLSPPAPSPLFERVLRFLFGAPVSDADAAKLHQEYLGGMTKTDWRAEREWQAEQDAVSAWWNHCIGDET